MKSVKRFFISMLVLVVIYFVFDYLKSTYFLTNYHGLFIRLRTFTLIAGGIFTIYLSFEKRVFKLFCYFYTALWFFYLLLKAAHVGLAKMSIISLAESLGTFAYSYSNFTQIFSITPFVVFSCVYWLVLLGFSQRCA